MQWLRFKLLKRPYYDARLHLIGKIPHQWKNRRRRKDTFTGGGFLYPDLSKYKVVCQFDGNKKLYSLLDEDQATIDALCNRNDLVKFDMTPVKTIWFAFWHFHPTPLTPEEALEGLLTDCGLPERTTLNEDLTPYISLEEEEL